MLEHTINCLMFFSEAAPSLKVMADAVERYIWPNYRFSCCISKGTWVSKHAEMDRDYHFRERDVADEKDIESWTQSAMMRAVDKDYPPWRCCILRAPPGRRSAVFWQIHHSVGDGISLLLAISPMLGIEGGDVVGHIPLPSMLLPKDRRPVPKSGGVCGGGCCPLFMAVVKFCEGCFMVAPTRVRYDSELKFAPPLEQRKPIPRFSGRRVFTRFPQVPMSKIKRIKSQHQCSVNDVLMAALTGALRRYGVDELKDPMLVDGQKAEFKAIVMMALPRPMDTSDLANRILALSCPLPIDEPTPQGRLARTKASFDSLKPKPFIAGAKAAADCVSWGPACIEKKLCTNVVGKHTMLVTNVPFTTKPVTFPMEGGAQLAELQLAFPNLISQVSIITYNEEVCANIVADPALFPEPEKLARLWCAEFDALLAAASEGSNGGDAEPLSAA